MFMGFSMRTLTRIFQHCSSHFSIMEVIKGDVDVFGDTGIHLYAPTKGFIKVGELKANAHDTLPYYPDQV